MKSTRSRFYFVIVTVFGLAIFPVFAGKNLSAFGQGFGNEIDGYIVGVDRQPVADLNVELLDSLGRTSGHARTDTRGYYSFHGMGRGRFTVRVYTWGTDYEEAENSTEIVNIDRQNPNGGQSTGAPDHEEVDFSLKLRRGLTPEAVALFVQEIPAEAQKHYEKAQSQFASKRSAEAVAELKAALEIFPKYYYALERLGIEYVHMDRPEGYDAAALLLGMAVDVNPRGFKSWYNLAYARYMLKAYPAALAAAQKAVEINGESPESAALNGTLLRITKKSADAERLLLKAKELSRDTMPQVHYQLALLYGKDMERYADAARELRAYLKAQPDDPDKAKLLSLIATFEAKAQKT
jgi:Flp pilus assembly protein TadD